MSIPPAADAPCEILLSIEERQKSLYNVASIQRALEALHQDGFVVLKDVVDVQHVENLNEYMCQEAEVLVSTKAKPFNQGVNSNILQAPPLTKPEYLYNDVFFNPFVIQLMNAYLGHRPLWNFITSNNALPNTHGLRQPVHKDIRFFHPRCPFYVIANIPLGPFTVENGATEFWLGSNVHADASEQIVATPEAVAKDPSNRVGEPMTFVKAEVLEARRAIRPPIQPICQPGDIMLRDLRTWHAGMPNSSKSYRIMLALGYQAQWYPNHTLRLKLPLSQGNFFLAHDNQPVEVRANLLPDDSDFGKLNDDFNFRPS